jgi:glycosyltransferase involved in cell wall biosynthesis
MTEGGGSTATPAPMPTSASLSDRPLVTLLVLAFNQEAYVEHAVRAALAQTYSPLEILVSDDASTDGTWKAIERSTAGYAGPHRVVLNRNPRNLGIGAHISLLVERSRGALLFIAAADDVSLPQRCERVVDAWLAASRKPDLISSSLIDLDAQGRTHEQITPTDLSTYHNATDWLARPPHVVGAAQAWTRRVFDRFGPLPAGVVGEDLLMVFRAVTSGGAITLAEPLVQYRRGGISRRRRTLRAQDVINRLLKNNRSSLIELPQLLADARVAGQFDVVQASIGGRIAREEFIRDMFAARSLASRITLAWRARQVPGPTRGRILVYAASPWLLAPFFALKRTLARER